jgi:hypothetical protein
MWSISASSAAFSRPTSATARVSTRVAEAINADVELAFSDSAAATPADATNTATITPAIARVLLTRGGRYSDGQVMTSNKSCTYPLGYTSGENQIGRDCPYHAPPVVRRRVRDGDVLLLGVGEGGKRKLIGGQTVVLVSGCW